MQGIPEMLRVYLLEPEKDTIEENNKFIKICGLLGIPESYSLNHSNLLRAYHGHCLKHFHGLLGWQKSTLLGHSIPELVPIILCL